MMEILDPRIPERRREFVEAILRIEEMGLDEMLARGLVSTAEYKRRKGREFAYRKAVTMLDADIFVGDEEFEGILADALETFATPTQTEINTANIDYLLMIGGER